MSAPVAHHKSGKIRQTNCLRHTEPHFFRCLSKLFPQPSEAGVDVSKHPRRLREEKLAGGSGSDLPCRTFEQGESQPRFDPLNLPGNCTLCQSSDLSRPCKRTKPGNQMQQMEPVNIER